LARRRAPEPRDEFWDGEAEGFCCFEVDGEFELGRELDWQVGQLCAAQDAVHVGRAVAVLFSQIPPYKPSSRHAKRNLGGDK
jgi:hypothetical protein